MGHLTTEPTDSQKPDEVSFVADARLISILGEQLIGSEKVGVLELVKNAYDADASTCVVTIEGAPGLPSQDRRLTEYAQLPGPIIEIRDDGTGMSRDDIVSGWLRPATAKRAQVKDRLREERRRAIEQGTLAEYDAIVEAMRSEQGRLPLGEKGIGRLATHRLGQHLWLRTKTAADPSEWELRIDWRAFDSIQGKSIDLSSIKLELKHQNPTTEYGPRNSGTVICCYGGRPGYEWTEDALVELGQAVVSLQSPHRGGKFQTRFVTPHVEESRIASPLERLASPFELHAIVDDKGIADIELRFTAPEHLEEKPRDLDIKKSVDLRRRKKTYWKAENLQLRAPVCGPFYIHIRSWVRIREWLGPEFKTITEYLDRFGGLAVYRDGILAQAAQLSSKNDWLGLSIQQIKKTSKISYYQLSGEIELDQSKTLDLRDRSSREGMIETQALRDLAELTRAVIHELETHTREVRDDWTKKTRSGRVSAASLRAETRMAANVHRVLVERYDFSKDPLELKPIVGSKARVQAVGARLETLHEYLKLREEEIAGLAEVAGFGLAIAVGVHELGKLASAIAANARFISRSPTSDEVPNRARDITRNAESLLAEVRRIEPLRSVRTAAPRSTTARRVAELARNALGLSLDRDHIAMSIQGDDFPLLVKVGSVAQVFANLVDNSVYWLSSTGTQRKEVRITLYGDKRRVLFADSGPGISSTIKPHLFKPFYSEKSPPSGLGLYICRHYLAQERASIRLAREDERCELLGAQFVIDFSKTPGDAE
jgi:signal transduction histidine kinase